MKRMILGTVVIVAVLSFFVALVTAQTERPQPPRLEQRQRPSQAISLEERLDRILDRIAVRLNLDKEQRKAIKDLVMAKIKARRNAEEGLRTLRRLARNQDVSEADIKAALTRFRQERERERTEIQKLEKTAFDMVPVKARLDLTIVGIFDNGLPFPPEDLISRQQRQRSQIRRGGVPVGPIR